MQFWLGVAGLALTAVVAVIQIFFPTIGQKAAAIFAPAPPFFATVNVGIGSNRRDRGSFYIECWRLGKPNYLAPINMMLHVVIVNKTKQPQMIDAYGVEAKTEDGKWASLVRIEKENLPVYTAISFNPLVGKQLSESSEFLDRVLQGKEIRPGETVQGYAMFEYPRDYNASTFSAEFRVTIHTFSGIDYKSPINTPLPDSTRKPLNGVQPNPLVWLSGTVDLGHYPIWYYDDVTSELPASPPPLGGG